MPLAICRRTSRHAIGSPQSEGWIGDGVAFQGWVGRFVEQFVPKSMRPDSASVDSEEQNTLTIYCREGEEVQHWPAGQLRTDGPGPARLAEQQEAWLHRASQP